MKRLISMLSAVAMLGFAGLAQAEDASGRVQSVDPAAGILVLEDGTAFTVQEGTSLEGLQPGTEVTVSYEEEGGIKKAMSITAAQ